MPQRLLKPDWWRGHIVGIAGAYILLAVTLVLVLGIGNQARQNKSTLKRIESERQARTAAFCEYAFKQQQDKRSDAIRGYLQLPLYLRFFNDPAGDLLVVAHDNLVGNPKKHIVGDLHEKYGNNRLPKYCPQHDQAENLPNIPTPSALARGVPGI